MNGADTMPGLIALLQQEQARRDQAAALAHEAAAAARRAHAQAEQLQAYRVDYQARWAAQAGQGLSIEIVHCRRSFLQRLDQASAQQARTVAAVETRLARARDALLAQEQRCAAVQRLIERRRADAQRLAQRRDQKHTDELAQRLHWQRRALPSA
jgi:flagellar FliJ protein